MPGLTGNQVNQTYDALLKMDDNGPIDAAYGNVTDGLGNSANFQINNAGVKFIGNADFTSATVTGITTTDTTYDLTSAQATDDVNINLVPSSGVTDTVTLVAGTNITLTDNGSNSVTIDAAGGGSGTPGGSDTQIQYNNGGAFGGTSQLTYNDATNEVFIGPSGGLTLSAGANLNIAQGDLTMTDGDILISGSVTVAEGQNVNMTTGGVVSWANSIGSFKADGITWPNAENHGETLDTVATGETFQARTAITTTQGLIYNLRPSVGGWALADADAQDSSAGMLGVSVNGGSTSRFFIRGLISIQSTNVNGTSTSIGDIVYLSEEAGHFDTDAPSGAGDVVRKVGQIVDSYTSGRTTFWKIWFDPDWYYTTV